MKVLQRIVWNVFGGWRDGAVRWSKLWGLWGLRGIGVWVQEAVDYDLAF
ncbi:MAG: hypothetical protein OSJ62_07935 [Lachnospiraceae bacterium]|nr:hypothetical protein [Lachnospiraceae bacterium]